MLAFGGCAGHTGRPDRKGAIELSLGFIVTVVFAVVLLSLAIFWIQGIFTSVTDLTEDMESQASQKLAQTFQETDKNYAIWPYESTVPPGTKIAVSTGIKNNAMDGNRHSFLVNIQPVSLPTGITSQMVMSWIEWAKPSKSVNPGETTRVPIYITIPKGTRTGTYIFRITACSECEEPRCPVNGATSSISYDACTPDSNHIWGAAAEDFVLIVE